LPYQFFKQVERYLYSTANIIGIQTPANLKYFEKEISNSDTRIEVLQNWLAKKDNIGCSIKVEDSILKGRKIFVYAGNMGKAQALSIFIDLAESLYDRKDIGFLFVGRGNDFKSLCEKALNKKLDNIKFYNEIEPSQVPGLYSQCHFGIVALDPRHKTHNIPGKFLSYLQAGLPVLACINKGNDLKTIIEEWGVGRACTENSVDSLQKLVVDLANEYSAGKNNSGNCYYLSEKLFSPNTAVKQIVSALDI
jgi:glycosyltransferase involved in cell wall biosynthesis